MNKTNISPPRIHWVATLNNPEGEEDEPVNWLVPHCKWAVWQKEKGESGTPHFQMAFGLRAKSRLSALKKLHARAHFEPMKGTPQQAADYCCKTEGRLGEPCKHGTVPGSGQGARNDLLAIKEAIDAHQPLLEVYNNHFGTMVRCGRGVGDYIALKNDHQRDWVPDIYVFYGPTGTGKSRRAQWLANQESAKLGQVPYWLMKPGGGGTVWWSGYDGHAVVVIDEFYGWITYDMFLRLLDRYPMRGETKGGSVNLIPKVIIVTSNHAPETWYSKLPDTSALSRRLAGAQVSFMGEGVWEPPAVPDAASAEADVECGVELNLDETDKSVPASVSEITVPRAPKKRRRTVICEPSESQDEESSGLDLELEATQCYDGLTRAQVESLFSQI